MPEQEKDIPTITRLRRHQQLLVEEIKAKRLELEKVEYAIRAYDRPDLLTSGVQLKVTEGGSVKDLAATIKEYLESTNRVATASDMCDALYSFSLPLSQAKLLRRISVTSSAMYKVYNPPLIVSSGLKSKSREVYWALPNWMEDDKLGSEHEPIED